MCTNIRICQPEGQHRMECASRVLYGYPLLSPAPLRDSSEILQDKMDINLLLSNLQCVPSASTVFGNIPCVMYYPKLPEHDIFNVTELRSLNMLSSTVQTQNLLEVESSYHSFYFDLNQDINKAIEQEDRDLLSETDWAHLPLLFFKRKDKTDIVLPEHEKLFALHHIINREAITRIYKCLPFNKDLPKIHEPNGQMLQMPMKTFFERTRKDILWPTNGLKWKLYHTNLYGRVKANLSNFNGKYFEIRELCKNISSTQDSVLAAANWKSLQVHILFDLFFVMKTEKKHQKHSTDFLPLATPTCDFTILLGWPDTSSHL